MQMIHLFRVGAAALLTSCFACSSFAEDRPGPAAAIRPQIIATERSASTADPAAAPTIRSPRSATDPTVISEIFQNIIVPPGNSIPLDSSIDYSSVGTVAVAVQCSGCSSAATSLGTSGLILQARWTVPNGALLVATENKAATTFAYWDAGGAIFNVYGPQFRLVLQNTGTQPISLQQITIFRRSQ